MDAIGVAEVATLRKKLGTHPMNKVFCGQLLLQNELW
jgi:hypothetical protein